MAAAGVDERAHHRLAGVPGGEPGLELGLPGVERGAARLGTAVAARPVDDLVGGPHVAVERVRGGADLLRQPPRCPVIRRIEAPVHPPARLVGAGQRGIDRLSRHPLRHQQWQGCSTSTSSTSPARAGWARRPSPPRSASRPPRRAGARSSARSPSRSACRARSSARASSARPRSQLADNLWAISIDPNLALQEWLSKQLGGGAPVRLLARSSAFQYFVAAAPGAREMITIAKVFELAQLERWDRRHRTYDLVIVDAPASGHGLAMLSTPKTFGEIARMGPIKRQAEKISADARRRRPHRLPGGRAGRGDAGQRDARARHEAAGRRSASGSTRSSSTRSTPSATRRTRPRCCAAPPPTA